MSNVKNKTKGYNMISRDVVFDTTISDRARFLYVYMACKPEGWDFYQDKVAEELGYKKDTLRKYLDELITRGWITEEEQRNAGQFSCLCYTIEIVRRDGNLPLRKNTVTEKYRIGKNHNQKDIDNNSSTNNSPTIRDIDKKSISNDIPKKRFKKPTIEEIQAYIKEKKMHFDAERFFDYYECKGWVVGKSPMKDWKAACRMWEHTRKAEEKKEENTDEMPAGMTREKWMKIQEWMGQRLPRIWKYIDVDAFLSMEGKSGGDRYLQRDIMVAIDRSTYEGDMVEEFERLRWTDEFKNRLPCLQ